MVEEIKLSSLHIGQKAEVVGIRGSGSSRKRMIDMGMTRGTEVEVLGKAPLGDPIEFRLKGYHLSLRKAEADQILVNIIE